MRYFNGSGIDNLIARFASGGQRNWYLSDHLGTTRGLADAQNVSILYYGYTSFGKPTPGGTVGSNRFGFTGREFDPEMEISFYRSRYYDASTGRFISGDPLGFQAGDTNLYRYVGNNPVQFRDPSGAIAIAEYLSTFASKHNEASAALAGYVVGASIPSLAFVGEYLGNGNPFSAILRTEEKLCDVAKDLKFSARFLDQIPSPVNGSVGAFVSGAGISVTVFKLVKIPGVDDPYINWTSRASKILGVPTTIFSEKRGGLIEGYADGLRHLYLIFGIPPGEPCKP